MWTDVVALLASYPSTVLTTMDENGYPISMRCHPQPDTSRQVIVMDLPASVDLRPGPAGLLCHSHDEQLWQLTSGGVRGVLQRDAQGWFFQPLRIIPGQSKGLRASIAFIRNGRRNARRYLERHSLERLPIPWKALRDPADVSGQ